MAIPGMYNDPLAFLFSVCAFIHDYGVRYLALCNEQEKKFSSTPCKALVIQNILFLTYVSALLCAQRKKKRLLKWLYDTAPKYVKVFLLTS